MNTRIIRLDEVDSTNLWLRKNGGGYDEECVAAVAEHQTAGCGCGTNTWESERGKNLLVSIRVRPRGVAADRQFVLSMAGCLAVKSVLDRYAEGIVLKWPNDVYWHDRKLSGTLIACAVKGRCVRECIFGIGLNVNQTNFTGGAPNAVSLCQIVGCEVDRDQLLSELLERFGQYLALAEEHPDRVAEEYARSLYRREGFHRYRDADGVFEARIERVEPTGELVLLRRDGRTSRYAFKEVEFVI